MMIYQTLQRNSRLVIVGLLLLICACGGNPAPTHFSNPSFDFGYLERIAVLPLESLSQDGDAGERTARILTTELLSSGAVDVVEPGEVAAAIAQIPGASNPPSTEQVVALGKALQIQGVMVGSVTQYEVVRAGSLSYPVVTLDLHLLETETGAAVWAATHTEEGSTAAARLLGSGGQSISSVTRQCVQQILKSLFG